MNRPEKERMAWDAAAAAELSGAGVARRSAMLGELLPAVRARRRRRVAMRGAAVLAPVVGVAVLVWVMAGERRAMEDGRRAGGTPAPRGIAPREAAPLLPEAAPAEVHRVVVAVVRTDAGIVERWRARADAGSVERIGDRELNSLLAEAGLPPGVIRMQERVILAAELERPRDEDGVGPSGGLPDKPEPDATESGREVAFAYSLRR